MVSQETGGRPVGHDDLNPVLHQLASTELLRCCWLVKVSYEVAGLRTETL